MRPDSLHHCNVLASRLHSQPGTLRLLWPCYMCSQLRSAELLVHKALYVHCYLLQRLAAEQLLEVWKEVVSQLSNLLSRLQLALSTLIEGTLDFLDRDASVQIWHKVCYYLLLAALHSFVCRYASAFTGCVSCS